jgi:hypothetical protein
MEYVEQFKQNKYIYLKNFLDEHNCVELTSILKQAIKEGITEKDAQCPLSEAIHGHPTFDKLLEDLLPYFETASGLKLLPTYSYARLYAQGDELTKHTDRPACEISATVTLGFEGGVWPIYMDGNKVDMKVGDAVLYRGQEVEHWREKYVEGKWQAQVFLHYVDANGPHKNEKYDGRHTLGGKRTDNKRKLTNCAIFDAHLSSSFCDNIVNEYKKEENEKELPFIGDGETERINLDIRDVKRLLLPQNSGIGGVLTSVGLNANHYWWQYNITHSNQSEFLMYGPKGHYNAHVDTFHSHDNETRKLTVLAFLNDDFEGGKFFINADGNQYYPPQEKGTVLVFPSFMVHGVEPVTKGIRYSVVTWMVGPYFK